MAHDQEQMEMIKGKKHSLAELLYFRFSILQVHERSYTSCVGVMSNLGKLWGDWLRFGVCTFFIMSVLNNIFISPSAV